MQKKSAFNMQSKASQVRELITEVFSQHGCLNSMEVCRYVNNKVETDSIEDTKACYPRDFGFVTRKERCLWRERGCQWFSLKVYQNLRLPAPTISFKDSRCVRDNCAQLEWRHQWRAVCLAHGEEHHYEERVHPEWADHCTEFEPPEEESK